jgi:predicted MPP superfamily phosphohydrolase
MKVLQGFILFLFSISIYTCLNLNKILFLSDVHLELLYDSRTTTKQKFLLKCKNSTDYLNHEVLPFDYGRYNCNPSVVLLQTALKDIYSKFPSLDLIILGGDLIAHGLYDLSIGLEKEVNKNLYKETFLTIYNEIKKLYPNTKIVPIIGNNDFYEHYQTPDSKSQKEQIDFFKNLYFTGLDKDSSNKLNFKNLNINYDESLNAGMYYSYFDKNLRIKIIVLNSNIFSLKNNKLNRDEAFKQLQFLEDELADVERRNSKCFVVSHIPAFPYYNSKKFEFFYNDDFSRKIEELMYRYKNSIVVTVSGHTHWSKSGVRVKYDESQPRLRYTDKNEYFFSSINLPSLSPIFYNNPGYSVIIYDKNSRSINNIETHYADLQKTMANDEFTKNIEISPGDLFSNIYDFKSNLSFTNFDSRDFYDFIYNRLENSEILKSYQLMLGGRNVNSSLEAYKEYVIFMKSQGMIESESNLKIFKCSHKILFTTEADECTK